MLPRAALFIVGAVTIGGCSPANLDDVKAKAVARWREVGYEVVGYDGYEWGSWGLFGYGGAQVWYTLKRVPDNGILYSGYIQRWGDEYHIYGPHAIDAIRPR